jgi:predicted DNA-binding antitoxin AbrB/MazE fold protein
MTQTIDAVFENGVLKPLEDLHFTDGQQVRITVEMKKKPSADANAGQTARVLELAAKVYEGLSAQEIDEIEKAIERRPLFTRPLE